MTDSNSTVFWSTRPPVRVTTVDGVSTHEKYVTRSVSPNGGTVENYINALREASAGLDNATVDEEHYEEGGFFGGRVFVTGWSSEITETEIASTQRQLEAEQQRRLDIEQRKIEQLRGRHPELFK